MNLTAGLRHLFAVVLGISMATTQTCSGIVGYVNAQVREGFNLLANPLDVTGGTGTNNPLNLVLSSNLPNGTCVYRFSPATQYYEDGVMLHSGLGWYSVSGKTNDPDVMLNPGEGFVLQIPQGTLGGSNILVTFVGYVLTGPRTNPIPANYSLKGNQIPTGGGLQTSMGFPAVELDIVWRGNQAAQVFTEYDYLGSGTDWSPAEPQINVAEGFFVNRHPASATTNNWWTNNLQPRPASTAARGSPNSAAPELIRMDVASGVVTLEVFNPNDVAFDVQFSGDGDVWTTVASSHTGTSWSGPFPGGNHGYYQVVQP